MKDIMNKAVARTKKFVADHKVGIAVVGTSIVWYKINRFALAGHDDFLKEHGLFEEFYNEPEEEY